MSDESGLPGGFGPFPVVALGASAGGLEAFQTFFQAMPPASGMAFVVVVHLDPTHVSLLPDLLQRVTAMEVVPIEDGMRLLPDRVHVLPPNRILTVEDGILNLRRMSGPRGASLPIDAFFRSLAQDRGAEAACIILSGTGSDGTIGARAIKGAAGLVMVQDEESARFDGMPRSVVATGLADYVLPPEAMPAALLEYMARAARGAGESSQGPGPDSREGLQSTLLYLRAKTGHDFSEYKVGTLTRRIQRRMDLHQIDDLADYARFLRKSNREVQLLFKDLLVGITSFFRDPHAFETLGKVALPDLVGEEPEGAPVRIWVPGCSTGEEAYSLAILVREQMETARSQRGLQIFATDLDADAVAAARMGRYPSGIAGDVGDTRLRRFFKVGPEGKSFVVNKWIRDPLIFAPHNVIKDPPFSSVDLISCRNLLIYLTQPLQQRLLALFHYALNPGGVLFLGTSETIGLGEGQFEVLDRESKIFRKRPVDHEALRAPAVRFGPTPAVTKPRTAKPAPLPEEGSGSMQLLEAILRHSDHPPCVVVDGDNQVVYVHGETGRFLELAPGQVDLDLRKMVRYGLGKAVAKALREAPEKKGELVVEGLRVRHEGGATRLDLSLRPIQEPGPFRNYLIVSFLEVSEPESGGGKGSGRTAEELEEELEHTTQELQSTMEDLETSNEELQSANEELQSANEELQSANEELETSKEELQSLNEEAETVNAELQARVEELAAANDDLKNLLDSTQIATIFLDIDLRVRRFTPTATQILPLTDTDLGRPVKDLAARLEEEDLSVYAQEVLDTLVAQEVAVSASDGREFLMRVTPYRTVGNVIDGVVLTFQAK